MRHARLFQVVLVVGTLLALCMWARVAFDLGRRQPVLALPVWTFLALAAVLLIAHVARAARADPSAPPLARGRRLALVAAVPVAYLASALGCMGLHLRGRTPTCTVLTQGGIPIVTALALVFLATGRPLVLATLGLVSFGFLVPNCNCRNPVNAYWIDLLGLSPACYATAFGVTILAVAALHTRAWFVPTLLLCWSLDLAMLGFFVGHHFFDWPW